jgi:hypothetical protein
MSHTKAVGELAEARAKLDAILGRRKPTTREELDECVRILAELGRACGVLPRMGKAELHDAAVMFQDSITEVARRIQNFPK